MGFAPGQTLSAIELNRKFAEVSGAVGAVTSVNGATGPVQVTSANANHVPSNAGGVARPLRDAIERLGLHVDDFGAVGDGVTNDSAAIQAALDACAAAGGGVVRIGPKSYRVTGADLTIPTGVTLVGAWRGIGEQAGRDYRAIEHAIYLDPAYTIRVQWSAGLSQMCVVRYGMSYPTTARAMLDELANFAGTAITSEGREVRLDTLLILGFNRLIDHQFARPIMHRIWGDGINGLRVLLCRDIGRFDSFHLFPFVTPELTDDQFRWAVSSISDNGAGKIRLTLATPHIFNTGERGIVILGGFRRRCTLTVVSSTVVDLLDHNYSASYTTTSAFLWATIAQRDGIGFELLTTDWMMLSRCFTYGHTTGFRFGDGCNFPTVMQCYTDNRLTYATEDDVGVKIEGTANGVTWIGGNTSSCGTSLLLDSSINNAQKFIGFGFFTYENPGPGVIRVLNGRLAATNCTASLGNIVVEAGADSVLLTGCDFRSSTLVNNASTDVVRADPSTRWFNVPTLRSAFGRVSINPGGVENVGLIIEGQGSDASQGAQLQLRNTSGTNNFISIRGNPDGNLNFFNNSYSLTARLTQGGQWQCTGGMAISGGTSTFTVASANTVAHLTGTPTDTARGGELRQTNTNASAGSQDWYQVVNASGDIQWRANDLVARMTISQAGAMNIGRVSGATATQLVTIRGNRASPADNDVLSGIAFQGLDSAANPTGYAGIYAISAVVADGSEQGTLQLRAKGAGDSEPVMQWAVRADGGFQHRLGPVQLVGAGSPEGAITAPVGSTWQRTDGGAGTTFYVKESGTGNTGWVAK